MVVFGRAACGPVIDLARIDAERGADRQHRHYREDDEHCPKTEEISGHAGKSGGEYVARVIESLVASELVRKATLTDQAESNGGDGRPDRGAGNAADHLCAGYDGKIRPHENGD